MITQMSHPLRVRGLKLLDRRPANGRLGVASFTGAWIETAIPPYAPTVRFVASFTGAWIETYMFIPVQAGQRCRILYGCVD